MRAVETIEQLHIVSGADHVITFSTFDGSFFGHKKFSLHRSPDMEKFLRPQERGATMQFDDQSASLWIEGIELSRERIQIKTRGIYRKFEYDLTRLKEDQFESLIVNLDVMNAGNSFLLLIDFRH